MTAFEDGRPYRGEVIMESSLASRGLFYRLRTAVLVSSTLVVPFVVLQWVNRRAIHEDFPFVLFAFMFLHALCIVLLVAPALRQLRSGRHLKALKFRHVAGLAIAAVLISVYAEVVVDQLPCFLGVPNCD